MTSFALRHGLVLNNVYFNLNAKYGAAKVLVIKIAVAALQYAILSNPILIAKTELATGLYCLLIIKLAIDVLRAYSLKKTSSN